MHTTRKSSDLEMVYILVILCHSGCLQCQHSGNNTNKRYNVKCYFQGNLHPHLVRSCLHNYWKWEIPFNVSVNTVKFLVRPVLVSKVLICHHTFMNEMRMISQDWIQVFFWLRLRPLKPKNKQRSQTNAVNTNTAPQKYTMDVVWDTYHPRRM